MSRCECFVYLDDVEYSKNSLINRNSIKSKDGALLLTVPVRYKDSSHLRIMDIQIADPEAPQRHWKSLMMCYARAPYWSEVAQILEPLFTQKYQKLIDLNLALLQAVAAYLEIQSTQYLSSQLEITSQSSERLAKIAQRLGATTYISGEGARAYNDQAVFDAHAVKLEYLGFKESIRPQMWGDFMPRLSALDALFNMGRDCIRLL